MNRRSSSFVTSGVVSLALVVTLLTAAASSAPASAPAPGPCPSAGFVEALGDQLKPHAPPPTDNTRAGASDCEFHQWS